MDESWGRRWLLVLNSRFGQKGRTFSYSRHRLQAPSKPGASASRICRRARKSLVFTFDSEVLDIPQDQHSAMLFWKTVHCSEESISKFFLLQSLGWDLAPIRKILRNVITLVVLLPLLDGLVQMTAFLAELHLGFVKTDLDQPCAELCLLAEASNMLERLQDGLLSHLFRIGIILQECKGRHK